MRTGVGELVFEYPDMRVIVKNVPMSICDDCEERYVPGPIAVEISDMVDEFVQEDRRIAKRSQGRIAPRQLVLDVVGTDESLQLAIA